LPIIKILTDNFKIAHYPSTVMYSVYVLCYTSSSFWLLDNLWTHQFVLSQFVD